MEREGHLRDNTARARGDSKLTHRCDADRNPLFGLDRQSCNRSHEHTRDDADDATDGDSRREQWSAESTSRRVFSMALTSASAGRHIGGARVGDSFVQPIADAIVTAETRVLRRARS